MSSFLAMTRISPSLAALLGIPGGEATYTRSDLIRKIHSLYNEKVGCVWPSNNILLFDAKMRSALNIPDDQTVTVLNLAKFLRPHCLDLPPVGL